MEDLRIDAVLFNCEFERNIPVMRAAKGAGVKTCVIYDDVGDGFPLFEILGGIRACWRKGYLSEGLARRIVGTAARTLVFGAKRVVANYHAAIQSRVPDISGYSTPNVLARAKRRERCFFWLKPSSNMVLLGYPTSDAFRPAPLARRKERIVAVARWDAIRHKRPHVLMKVVEGVAAREPAVSFAIYGRTPDFMRRWYAQLADSIKARVNLAGSQPIGTVASTVNESMILYCPSVTEALPFPVVEALCSGCTVVGLGAPQAGGLQWAISEGDGTAARRDSVAGHVAAVIEELRKWRAGQRDPSHLTEKWTPWFSAPMVCKRLLDLIGSNS